MMRTRIFATILFFFMLVLLAGLAYTQIFRHERYRVMSEENRIKVIPLMAPRGRIFDREGRILARDTLSFKVSVIYSRINDKDSLAGALSSVLSVPEEEIALDIEKGRESPHSPVCVAADVGMEKGIQIQEVSMDYPGLLLEAYAKREYVNGDIAANVLGHLGSINRSEFERLKHYGYKINDLIGRDGIEKSYDEYIRGKHGGRQVEVDHRGREITTLGYKEPVPGRDVHLTIDLELQKFCDDLLKDRRGAILAMNPATGAVLVSSSAPTYDPGVFVDRNRKEEVNALLNDGRYPLLNRAIAGEYPPGSVFKVMVAAGALEERSMTPETILECPGHFKLGRRTFHCWREKGHGAQTMEEGIKNSCNVYFFKTGLRLGADKLSRFAARCGFGARTGIDLPGERAGMLPTREWKRKRFNERWYKGDTVNFSIGQGYMLSTPLQIMRMIAVFANGGYLVRPYVVSSVGGISLGSGKKTALGISPETLETVREGLRKVVNDPTGTGIKARQDGIVIAGKTGTAQTSKGATHGWFAGFAPFENARLAVVVFDEYGGRGGYYAAGTARKIFRKAGELGLLESGGDTAG